MGFEFRTVPATREPDVLDDYENVYMKKNPNTGEVRTLWKMEDIDGTLYMRWDYKILQGGGSKSGELRGPLKVLPDPL